MTLYKTKYLPWNSIIPWNKKQHSCKIISCVPIWNTFFWKSGSPSFLSCISIGLRKVSPLQNKNVWFVPVFHLYGKPYYITQLYIDNLVLKINKIHVAQRGDLKAKFFWLFFFIVVLLLCINASNNENCSIYNFYILYIIHSFVKETLHIVAPTVSLRNTIVHSH